MIRLTTWLCGAVALVLIPALWAYAAWERPRVYHPTKLEKTCPFQGAWLPCFIVDEALQQTWDV